MSEDSRKPIVEMTADELKQEDAKTVAEIDKISKETPRSFFTRAEKTSRLQEKKLHLGLVRSESNKR